MALVDGKGSFKGSPAFIFSGSVYLVTQTEFSLYIKQVMENIMCKSGSSSQRGWALPSGHIQSSLAPPNDGTPHLWAAQCTESGTRELHEGLHAKDGLAFRKRELPAEFHQKMRS